MIGLRSFFFFFFFLPHHKATRDRTPSLLWWKCGILTTGLPGRSITCLPDSLLCVWYLTLWGRQAGPQVPSSDEANLKEPPG